MALPMSTTIFLWALALKSLLANLELQEKLKMRMLSNHTSVHVQPSQQVFSIGKLQKLFKQPRRETLKLKWMKNAKSFSLISLLDLSLHLLRMAQLQLLTQAKSMMVLVHSY
jgi:hypothetical protein